MKAWWPIALATTLTVGACGTTAAVGYGGSATPESQWRVEDASPVERPESAERPTDQPEVVIVATSPTAVEVHPGAQDVVVPLRHLHAPATTPRRARVHQGMWIGAGLGILAGALMSGGSADSSCGGGCSAILGSAVFGGIGLGLGAAAGGIIGRLESP